MAHIYKVCRMAGCRQYAGKGVFILFGNGTCSQAPEQFFAGEEIFEYGAANRFGALDCLKTAPVENKTNGVIGIAQVFFQRQKAPVAAVVPRINPADEWGWDISGFPDQQCGCLPGKTNKRV